MSDTYSTVLVSTAPQFTAFWPKAEPLLGAVVSRAGHGEYTLSDLRTKVQLGQIYMFVLSNTQDGGPNTDVKLVMLVEVVPYPQFKAMNILAVGGRDLDNAYREIWPNFCGWARMNGAKAIEGWVGPGMRKITSRMGFKPVYVHMRYDLTGPGNG